MRRDPPILGESAVWLETLAWARTCARTPYPVLLTGETGTGKEVLARLIHAESPAARGPFVAVNCAAVPDTLLDDELFGHASGAYTGAKGARRGRFELANGGTLFLDEIGELPPASQAKLLRVLDSGELYPLGRESMRRSTARVVAATAIDVDQAMAAGRFRDDLYYRLAVARVRLPPLRARPGDAVRIAEAVAAEVGCTLSHAAREAIDAHRWPGNVRELRSAVQMAALRSEGKPLEPHHLELG